MRVTIECLRDEFSQMLAHLRPAEAPLAAYTTSHVGKGTGRSVRTERFRDAQWGEGAATFLFDYQSDPSETTNLVDDSRYAETVVEMKRLLDKGWTEAIPN